MWVVRRAARASTSTSAILGNANRIGAPSIEALVAHRRCCWGGARCPFQALGLEKGASEEAVKSAYFELAKKCHPDVYEAPEAAHRFAEISSAYELLSDADTRHSYEAQAGLYQGGETSGKELFDRVFRDHRLRNPVQAVEERALHAVMMAKRGKDGPMRDFCVDYRLPPQFFLPRKAQLEARPGEGGGGHQGEPQQDDDARATIGDFFSKSPISGGA